MMRRRWRPLERPRERPRERLRDESRELLELRERFRLRETASFFFLPAEADVFALPLVGDGILRLLCGMALAASATIARAMLLLHIPSMSATLKCSEIKRFSEESRETPSERFLSDFCLARV